MNRQASIIFLVAFLLVGLFTVPTIATQTTGLTGGAFPSTSYIDLTQYTSDGLSGNAVFVYNPTTGLFELDDGYSTGVGTDVFVAVDAAATAGYLGATGAAGVLRTGGGLSYTDGGDFVTIDNTQQVKVDVAATAGYIGAASNDGVLRTGSGLTYTDGGDFVTINTDVSDGTANGQVLFWVNGTGTWDNSEVTEIAWDDTNKSLGIGADLGTYTASSYFVSADETLDTTVDRAGIYQSTIKTAGATDGSDDIYGVYNTAALNHNGGTIGDLATWYGGSTLTDGTVADIVGINTGTDLNGGTATNSYGIYNTNDIAAGVTALTNAYAEYQLIDSDQDLGGSLWGELNDINFVTGTITGSLYGNSIDITTSGGTVNDLYGQYTKCIIDDVTVNQWVFGEYREVEIPAGAVSLADDVYVEQSIADVDDDIGGTLYGGVINIDHDAGTISGDSIGLQVTSDYDSTVTGDTYGIQLVELTGVDYGYYQSGTAINHLEGTYESPFVALTLGTTNGDNDNQVVAAGQNFRITNATGNFNIGGLTTPNDGRQIYIYNTTAHNMTIEEAEIAEGGGFSPISTHGGGDLATTGAGCVTLVYSSSDSTWLLIDVQV